MMRLHPGNPQRILRLTIHDTISGTHTMARLAVRSRWRDLEIIVFRRRLELLALGNSSHSASNSA